MSVEVGQVLEGKVVKIAAFGAFVQLGTGETGLVHISEVANTFVNDINEHLKLGDEVKVKVVSLGDAGRISLSIKKALPPPERPQRGDRPPRPQNGDRPHFGEGEHRPQQKFATPPPQPQAPLTEQEAFEERLSHFMQESKKNLAGSSLYAAKKNRRRGGRG